jgi:hypothetical protein
MCKSLELIAAPDAFAKKSFCEAGKLSWLVANPLQERV